MTPIQLLSMQEFKLLQQGHEKTFQKVYEAYYGLIQYVVIRCGVANEEKHDLVQEAFLKLFTRAADIKQPEAIKAWLVTCAYHLAIDYLRKKQSVYLEGAAMEEAEQTMLDHTRENHERELEIRLVTELIKRICTEESDDTFSLYYIEGLSARVIAEQKAEPVSTVTNRLSRLRKKFKDFLQEHINHLNHREQHDYSEKRQK